ncbi:putative autophagy protein [Phaeomoniella chlamydospora]|uniref:Autophagy-related protein 9 n=1 Tax=Phaeomoniella chlamydospora TaxID=158046 RepID=A0A0G2EZ67_PHACM|nr:putative autophagy protein [Phaeomoniella chlamydospora]
MASNLLSRLLPAQSNSPSIYETLRRQDDSDNSDLEERAGLAIDEENFDENDQQFDYNDAQTTAADSHITLASRRRSPSRRDLHGRRSVFRSPKRERHTRPRWMQGGHGLLNVEEADDEVPASLLIEDNEDASGTAQDPGHPHQRVAPENIPAARPVTDEARHRWETTQARQRLHPSEDAPGGPPPRMMRPPTLAFADPKDKAMWRWANVENLDNFLNDIYVYYIENGIWSIVLHRILNLLTLGFVVGFSVFLLNCVDYRSVSKSVKMSEVIVPKCMKRMSTGSTFLLWLFYLFWVWKLVQYVLDYRRLRNIHDFYHYLLGVSDVDLQTISWQEVVSRLMTLRDANPATAAAVSAKHRRFLGSQSKQRMDAHDIANRLLRKENYLIAMFNKEILNLTLPIPYFKQRQLLSRTLMWNIDHCILDFVFDRQGQVHTTFLKDTYRAELSDALRKRFLFAGVMNIITAPFLVVYFMMLYFFQYFNEYQKNPSAIGSRQYTLLAKWKFREFNELPHLFKRRIDMSYPFASRYIDQFPKDKTAQISRFVSFIAGALTSVLALATVVYSEVFLGFELTSERTVLFYLSIFGTIWAVSKGMVPEENLVFDPDYALQEVIDFTHYCPNFWDGRLHSDEVRQDFASLYQMKVVIFLEEILSMIFTPFLLFFSLPQCSERLIDFFREFTVHVDGLGYVCSFAVFDFKKNGNAPRQTNGQPPAGPTNGLRDDYYATKDQKLEASYWGFMNDYARNPKTGIPFLPTQSRRKVNPPPPFPGLTSPKFQTDPAMSVMRHDYWERGAGRPSPNGTFGTRANIGQGSHYAAGALPSPLTSMLLDPHHQPSSSAIRTTRGSRGANAISRSRSERGLSGAVVEEGEHGPESLAENRMNGDSVEQSTGDSRLGDSWKVNQAAAVEDDDQEMEEGVRAVTGDQGTGVLGLIKQFQKAQTERRSGGGIKI